MCLDLRIIALCPGSREAAYLRCCNIVQSWHRDALRRAGSIFPKLLCGSKTPVPRNDIWELAIRASLSQSQISLIWVLVVTVVMGGILAFLVTAWLNDASPVGFVAPVAQSPVEAGHAINLSIEKLVPDARVDVGAAEAMRRNLAIPLSHADNPVAPRFDPRWLGKALNQEINCLATAVYYEAAGEPLVGQRAVAQVVLNRMRNPRYPKTVCGVVYQGSERPTGCQFSFTCDGALARSPAPSGWSVALAIATAALNGATSREAGQATHYHTMAVFPVWATELLKTAVLGHHIFYRLPGRTYDYAEVQVQNAAQASADPVRLPMIASPSITADDGQVTFGVDDTVNEQKQPAAGGGPLPVPTDAATPASRPTVAALRQPETQLPLARKRSAPLPLSSIP